MMCEYLRVFVCVCVCLCVFVCVFACVCLRVDIMYLCSEVLYLRSIANINISVPFLASG